MTPELTGPTSGGEAAVSARGPGGFVTLSEHDVAASQEGAGLETIRRLETQQYGLALARVAQAAEEEVALVHWLTRDVELRHQRLTP